MQNGGHKYLKDPRHLRITGVISLALWFAGNSIICQGEPLGSERKVAADTIKVGDPRKEELRLAFEDYRSGFGILADRLEQDGEDDQSRSAAFDEFKRANQPLTDYIEDMLSEIRSEKVISGRPRPQRDFSKLAGATPTEVARLTALQSELNSIHENVPPRPARVDSARGEISDAAADWSAAIERRREMGAILEAVGERRRAASSSPSLVEFQSIQLLRSQQMQIIEKIRSDSRDPTVAEGQVLNSLRTSIRSALNPSKSTSRITRTKLANPNPVDQP